MPQIPHRLEKPFHWLVDRLFAVLPQPVPDREQLGACKIVSHRGEHDNRLIFENTIPAFDRVKDIGIWGLEFDVRWTQDLQPIIFHDRDCYQLFGKRIRLNEVTLTKLKAELPIISTLEELIVRYGGKLHLMIELKREPYPDPARQGQLLKELLESLRPGIDFHLLSLDPQMFAFVDFMPHTALLPVSLVNIQDLSQISLQRKYAGIAAHYALLRNCLLVRHHQRGQKVGTGFVFSKNCLFREINRGVDWIFTNHAVKVQRIRDACLRE